MTVRVFQHMFLTLGNCALIWVVFSFATIPFWIFSSLIAMAVLVDFMALAWTFGHLPGEFGAEAVGALWVVIQIIQLIVLVIIVSITHIAFSFLFFVLMLYWGKLRQNVIGKMFDTRF